MKCGNHRLREPLSSILAALSLGVCLPINAQPSPTFRTSVSEVHVDVEVLDRNGAPVRGLSKEDFRVFDEGHEEATTGFEAGEQALDIVLLFDVSGSMRPNVEKVVKSADLALAQLREGDRVAVMNFTSHIKEISPFSRNLDEVGRSVQSILQQRFFGNTRIRRALFETAAYMINVPAQRRRRAIVIVTDNIAVGGPNQTTVVRNLWEADAVVCGIIVPEHRPRRSFGAPLPVSAGALFGDSVGPIAEKTGGASISLIDAESDFPRVVLRLRNRYSLYYAPPPAIAGSTRSVQVRLSPSAERTHASAQISARKGYVVP